MKRPRRPARPKAGGEERRHGEESGEEIDPSAPIYQEATVISASELVLGAPNGVLADDFVIWSEGPYPYADYVFRGASKVAKLVEPPVGYRDL